MDRRARGAAAAVHRLLTPAPAMAGDSPPRAFPGLRRSPTPAPLPWALPGLPGGLAPAPVPPPGPARRPLRSPRPTSSFSPEAGAASLPPLLSLSPARRPLPAPLGARPEPAPLPPGAARPGGRRSQARAGPNPRLPIVIRAAAILKLFFPSRAELRINRRSFLGGGVRHAA